jgi:predicted hydrocarbon binding protein
MHGVFHRGFRDFVLEEYGDRAWSTAREASGVDRQVYLPVNYYPDAEFISLVEGVGSTVDDSPFDLLEEFGRFMATRLLDTYGRTVDDGWDALAVVERAESDVHAALREHDPELSPPRLDCTREGPDRVRVVYASSRRLCPVAVGLVEGVGAEFGESLSVTEERCVHRGDERCELVVTRR